MTESFDLGTDELIMLGVDCLAEAAAGVAAFEQNIANMLREADRDIYLETVAAVGRDPLLRPRPLERTEPI